MANQSLFSINLFRKRKRMPTSGGPPSTLLRIIGILLFLACAAAFWVLKEQQFEEVLGSQPTPVTGQTLHLYVINIGQGDALLLRTEGHNMLVDAGPNKSADGLLEYLDVLGVESLDYAVGTHPDEDHIGGLDKVLDKYDVKTLLMPKKSANTKTFEDVIDVVGRKYMGITAPRPGDRFTLGGAEITVLGPQRDDYTDTNDFSIVLRVVFGDVSFLLTGDCEKLGEQDILDAGVLSQTDVLKVAHHGSSTSSTAAFLDVVRPKYALISCGADNKYGHPHEEVVGRLEDIGAEIYRTDLDGSLLISTDGKTVTVQTAKENS